MTGMKMTRKLLVNGLLTGTLVSTLALTATGCADPPKSGVVTSNEFNKGHYEEEIYCAAQTVDKNGIITCTLYLPRQYWVDDEWRIRLLSDDGKHRGWRSVPVEIFNRCGIDKHYPGCVHDRGY
jgi:hypothetical protein